MLSRCWVCHTWQLTWSSQLPQVVPVIPDPGGGYQDSKTTGDSAKSHGWCRARPALNSDLPECVFPSSLMLSWEWVFLLLPAKCNSKKGLGEEETASKSEGTVSRSPPAVIPGMIVKSCFFPQIPASQAVPLGSWGVHTPVGLKKYQEGKRPWVQQPRSGVTHRSRGSSTLPEKGAMLQSPQLQEFAFFSCSSFLISLRSVSRSRGLPSHHEWAGKGLPSTFWHQKEQL